MELSSKLLALALLLLGLLLMAIPLRLMANPIEGKDVLHASAHIGTSWAITHATEVVCKKVTGRKIPCLITGVAVSLAAGVLKEAADGAGDDHLKGFAEDGVGIGLAATFIAIDW